VIPDELFSVVLKQIHFKTKEKKVKKILFIVIFAGLCCLLFAGAQKEKDIVLKMTVQTRGGEDYVQPMVEAFKTLHPEVKDIEWAAYPPADQDLVFKKNWAAGEQMDLMLSNGQFARHYWQKKMIQDLRTVLPKDFIDSFYPRAISLSENEQGILMFIDSVGSHAVGVFYNPSIFDQLGLGIPSTWDQMYSISSKIQSLGIDAHCYPGEVWWNANLVGIMLPHRTANEPVEFTLNQMKGKERYDGPVFSQVLEDVLELKTIFPDGFLATDYQGAINSFVTAKSAMFIMGSWVIGQLRQAGADFSIFPPPVRENTKTQTIGSPGLGWMVTTRTEYPELCSDLIEFACNDEWSKRAYQSTLEPGGVNRPRLEHLLEDPIIKKWVKEIYPTSYLFPDWFWEPDLKQAINSGLSEGFAGLKSAQEIAADVQKVHDQLVEEGRSRYPQ
jgi:ABC-type glycerol-3-phosphate transport system substrate-binding protein